MVISDKLPNHQFVCVLVGQVHPWRGYVVIDSIVNGKATGGIRMAPDVPLFELMHLARAMTLKYGFLGLPRGGAKAGILADPEVDPAIKRAIFQEFGQRLAPLLQSRIYEPSPDMGVSPEDVSLVRQSAGIRDSKRGKTVSYARSGFYTSLTVLAAAQAAVEKLQLKFPRCTAAIEGFGNVGGSLALGYARQGVKVVAVSTIQGAIYDPHGLDIPRLLKIYREFGSGMVEKASAEQISKEEIVELDVDILSPCARGWSITEQNAERIKAKIIAPGANCPVTPEAERILAEKRILSVPHFAANCGGALGSTMEFLGCKKEQIANFIAVEVKKKITVLLDKAECQQILPSELAEKEALAKLKAMRTSYQNGLKSIALRLGMEAYKSGLLPAGLTRIALLHYLKRRLWSG